MSVLEIKDLVVRYDQEKIVLNEINFQLEKEDFLVILGPSGCGKTTLLRAIAGLVDIDSGSIHLGEKRIDPLPPQERGLAMVFQNYALYPHMNVQQNMEFALEIQKMAKEERRGKILELSKKLGIEKFFKRRPNQLSGGERQRVAIGRAMVMDAHVLLFDEPLANLDAMTRRQLRKEIQDLHRNGSIPFIYVTHEQTDAFTLATKVVVMNHGEVQQIGSANELFQKPRNTFVASFLGEVPMNLLDSAVVENVSNPETFYDFLSAKGWEQSMDGLLLGIRPSDIYFEAEQTGDQPMILDAVLESYENMGASLRLQFKIGELELTAVAPANVKAKLGEKSRLYIHLDKIHFFDRESGLRIE